MSEYIKIGYMKPVTERPKQDEIIYWIPHHCVSKGHRIEYDASCKTEKGISLNDIQLKGPKLQNDLHITLMRFRRHPIAFYAHINGMYNQIKIPKDQYNLQRIFWIDENGKERQFQLTVVTFGLTASPHMAVSAVQQCARDAATEYSNKMDTWTEYWNEIKILENFKIDQWLGTNNKARDSWIFRQQRVSVRSSCLHSN